MRFKIEKKRKGEWLMGLLTGRYWYALKELDADGYDWFRGIYHTLEEAKKAARELANSPKPEVIEYEC